MKTKGLIFVSCLAAGALIASPAMGKPAKKSKSKRMAPQTTQVTRHNQNQVMRHNQNIDPRMGNTRNYGTRSYAGRQYTGTRYDGGTQYYGSRNYYGGGTRYYYGGGYAYPNYGYYSGWPSSNWGYGTSGYYPYSYYGGYPYSGYNNYYSYYGGYPYGGYSNRYSYYTPTYSYSGSTVAAVQQRLGRLGYYHGSVDGVIGPQTRNAIAAFQSRNGLGVDGTINRPLLNSLGLA
jgi:Putative peptidoglycan binding domain